MFSVGPIFLFEVHAGSGATCGPKFFFPLTASPRAVDLGAPQMAGGSHSLGPTNILRLTVHTVSRRPGAEKGPHGAHLIMVEEEEEEEY